MNAPTKPANEIRLGTVKAAIWRNETESGPRFSTTFSRFYRDGDQWHNTDSFNRDDLLLVAKLADLAHTWIFAQGKEPGAAPQRTTAPDHRSGGPPRRQESAGPSR